MANFLDQFGIPIDVPPIPGAAPPPPGFMASVLRPPLPAGVDEAGNVTPEEKPTAAEINRGIAAGLRGPQGAPQLPNSPFPVAPGAPYARELAPVAQAVTTAAQPAAAGASIQPATVPDMARQQADVIRNLLGERPRGMSGMGQWYQTPFDLAQDRDQKDYDVRANALLGHLGELGRQAGTQGELNLRRIQTLGLPGMQGSMARDNALAQANIESTGLQRQVDAQQAAAYNGFVQARVGAGASIQDARREWQEAGNPIPQFAGGPGAGATGNRDASRGEGNPPPLVDQTAQSRLEQIHRTVLKRNTDATGRIADPNAAITDFVTSLGNDFVGKNTPEVMKFIIDRFGGPAADAWFTARSSRLGRQTPQEAAIASIMGGANARQPGVVGTGTANRQTGGILGTIASLVGR